MKHVSNISQSSLILVLFLSLAGFGIALFEFVSPRSGTAGTAGALLVTVSTALLALGAVLLAFVHVPRWFGSPLLAFLLIDAVATAVAGYFLMSTFLVAAMIGALLAGIAAAGGRRRGG